jgi:hypothetical protein
LILAGIHVVTVTGGGAVRGIVVVRSKTLVTVGAGGVTTTTGTLQLVVGIPRTELVPRSSGISAVSLVSLGFTVSLDALCVTVNCTVCETVTVESIVVRRLSVCVTVNSRVCLTVAVAVWSLVTVTTSGENVDDVVLRSVSVTIFVAVSVVVAAEIDELLGLVAVTFTTSAQTGADFRASNKPPKRANKASRSSATPYKHPICQTATRIFRRIGLSLIRSLHVS